MNPPMTQVQQDKFLPLLFNYGSTYLTDYQEPGRLIATPERSRVAKAERPRPPYLGKDTHTLQYYKDYLPFDNVFRFQPKGIVREVPKYSENVPKIEVDERRQKEVRRTRPRLILTPALSLDDVADESARDIIVRSIYQTSYRDANRYATVAKDQHREPLPKQLAVALPVPLPVLSPPRVPELWRRDAARWDRRQNRAFCDPDLSFWKDYNVYKWCPPCHETARQEKQKRDQLLAAANSH